MRRLPPLAWLLAAALAAALALTGPALCGGRDFVPLDLRGWPPWSLELAPEEARARRQAGNLDVTEKLLLNGPDLALARSEIANGRIPLWHPGIRTGAPLLAHSLDGLLFPPHWLLLLLPPGRAFALVALLSFLLAAGCTYLLLRHWGLHPLAAAGGGLGFAFSTPLAANAHFYMRHDALALLPALLLGAELWAAAGGPAALLLTALATAGLWLAGFPPYAVLFTLALLAWTALKLPAAARRGGRREAARVGLGVAAAAAAGLLLAAPQLLPLATYLPWSQRTVATAGADPRAWGADPAVLLTWLVPDLFGSPGTSATVDYARSPLAWLLFLWRRDGVGLVARFNFTENVVYAGALPLLLALWGAARPWPGRRGPLLALGLGALVLATGLEGGLTGGLVPGLRAAMPARLLPVAALVAAAFAARGLDLLLAGRRPPAWVAAAGIAVAAGLGAAWLLVEGLGEEGFPAAVLAALAGRFRGPGGEVYTPEHIEKVFLHRPLLAAAGRNLLASLAAALPWWAAGAGCLAWLRRPALRLGRPWFARLAVLLAMADLLRVALPLCPSFPALNPFAGTGLHVALARERAAAAQTGGITLARLGDPAGSEPALLPPNLAAGLGVRDLQAYAFVDRRSHEPLAAARRRLAPEGPGILLAQGPWIGNLPDDPLLEHPVLDRYGVTHLLAATLPRRGRCTPVWREEGRGGSLVLLRREGAPGRARIVPLGLPLPEAEILARLADPATPAGEAAFLPAGETELRGGGGGRVVFLRDRPGEVVLQVTGTRGGLLVVADTWAPGWRARLDGVRVPLLRADWCFRGVALPAGDHQVEFRLTTLPFRLGLGLALVGAAALAGLALRGGNRLRPASPAGSPGRPSRSAGAAGEP